MNTLSRVFIFLLIKVNIFGYIKFISYICITKFRNYVLRVNKILDN